MKKLLPVLFFLCLLSKVVLAQTPCFDVENTVGCTPFTIKVKNCAVTKSVIYYDYFGDNTRFTEDSVFTFTKPGVYSITQLVGKDSLVHNSEFYNVLTKSNIITVVDAKPPVFELIPCKGNKLKVLVNDNVPFKYSKYYVDFGDGFKDTITTSGFVEHAFLDSLTKNIKVTGVLLPVNCGADTTFSYNGLFTSLKDPKIEYVKTLVSSASNGKIEIKFNAINYLNYQFILNGVPVDTITNISGPQSYIFNNINTEGNTNIIQLNVIDVCGVDVINSEQFYVLPLKVVLQQNQNLIQDLSFTNSLAVLNYELYRNNVLYKVINTSNFPDYIDADVKCALQYCYQIKTILKSGIYLLSDTVCVTAISTLLPPVPLKVNSSVINNQIRIDWEIPTGYAVKRYDIYKSENNGAYFSLNQTSNNFYNDLSGDVNNSSNCFQLKTIDSCDNVSLFSLSTCPVKLMGTVGQNSVDLNWSKYIGWDGSSEKQMSVEWVDQNGQVYKSQNVGLNFIYTDNAEDTVSSLIRYRIKLEGQGDPYISYSNFVEKRQQIKMFFPTAFSPNNDGLNDEYRPKGRFVKDFKMYIYNQLGQLVFFSDDFYKGWNGGDSPSGDYVVTVESSDSIGNEINKRFVITLIK